MDSWWQTALIVFGVNWLLNIILIEFFALRPLKNVINVDEDRDSKYPAFRRLDTKYMRRIYLFPICHFGILKLIIVFFVIFAMAGCMTLVACGLKKDEECRGWRRKLNMVFVHIVSRAIIWGTCGAFWINEERPESICYKKYLGDSWEPDYDEMRCGTVISNHGAFIDSLVHASC